MAKWLNAKRAEVVAAPVPAPSATPAQVIDLAAKKRELSEELPERKIRVAVPKGVKLFGELAFDTSARIDGEYQGTIQCGGTLVVSENASVAESTIVADVVVIKGEAHATIRAKKRVEIASGGRFSGPIDSPALCIEEGALFSSETCSIRAAL